MIAVPKKTPRAIRVKKSRKRIRHRRRTRVVKKVTRRVKRTVMMMKRTRQIAAAMLPGHAIPVFWEDRSQQGLQGKVYT